MRPNITVVLQLGLPDVVAMQTRQPNLEGTGEIRLRRLVKEALRMRPDRLLGGQIEGSETSASPSAFSALPAPGGLCFSPARSPLGAWAPSTAASPVPAGCWREPRLDCGSPR